MKRILASFAVVCLMVTLASAQVIVNGRVVNDLSMSPMGTGIPGAVVQLISTSPRVPANPNYRTVTARDGSFSIPRVVPDTYQVVVRANGWIQSQRVSITISADPTGGTRPVTVGMIPVRHSPRNVNGE